MDIGKNEKVFIEQDNIKLADLLKCDDNNITYLERLIDQEKTDIQSSIIKKVTNEMYNNFQALCIYFKNCKTVLDMSVFNPEKINEDLLFKNVDSDKILLDYVKKKIFYLPSMINSVNNHTEIIDWIINKSYDGLLLNLNSNIIKKLFQNDGNGYLMDKYYEQKELFIPILFNYPDYVMDYCEKKNDYTFILGYDEFFYRKTLKNGKTVAESLLEKGIFPYRGDKFYFEKMPDLFIKYNRIDLLWTCKLSQLLKEKEDEGKSYLDIIIEKEKEGIDSNLGKILLGDDSNLSKARALLKIADSGLINYIPKEKDFYLRKTSLNNKCILEELNRLPHSHKLAVVLNQIGIEGYDVIFEPIIPSAYEAFRDSYYEKYLSNYTSVCPELLEELKELFYTDGKSNTKVIDCLIKSYNYLTSKENSDNELFVREVKQLITIKKNNMDSFIYRLDEYSSSRFNVSNGSIIVSNLCIPTINHETSHALHFYLTDFFIPKKYIQLCEIIRNSFSTLKKLNEWSDLYNKLEELLESQILPLKLVLELYYNTKFSSDEGLSYITNELSKNKEELRNIFKEDYNDQVLEMILNKAYTVEEYYNCRKKVELNEMKAIIKENECCGLGAITDILDAVYAGDYFDGSITDEDGKTIKAREGHGSSYFKETNHAFLEMIADYGTIIKSKENKDISIRFLRYALGDSLFNLIKNTYENDIIKSNKYMGTETKGYE